MYQKATTVPSPFGCDALYHGSKRVHGAATPSSLTSVAESVLNADKTEFSNSTSYKLPKGERCQLLIDEEKLKVSCIKKDEGFESDSESSITSSGDLSCGERLCNSNEIKVINDHVLRLEKLIRQDSGVQTGYPNPDDGTCLSLSSSSGAESEEESPKLGRNESDVQTARATRPIQTKDIPTDRMAYPVMEKSFHRMQPDSGLVDTILLTDILFCHVLSHRPKIVIVVVKSMETCIIQAHVFECLSHEAARTLYSNYYIASNKCKLNRYRNSKWKPEMNIGADEKATLDRIHVSIRNIRRRSFDNFGAPINQPESVDKSSKSKSFIFGEFDQQPQNKTDNANVNVIEIKDDSIKNPFAMTHRIDANGVTHIEIESAPTSLVSPTPPVSQQWGEPSHEARDILSALDRLSLHSSNNPNFFLNGVGITGSCPNSLIATSREIIAAGDKERKSRQRQPPLLIQEDQYRKATASLARKDIRRRSERRNRSKSEDRKTDPEGLDLPNIPSPKGHELQRLPGGNSLMSKQSRIEDTPSQNINVEYRQDFAADHQERQSRSRNPRSSEMRDRHRSTHNKGPAPPPPPRRHPSNPSLMLVPTKSGHEITKSYYPKESHITRGNKLIRIDYPVYPPWNINSDINNNPQRLYYARSGWTGSHEFHANRLNSDAMIELRKRSRSKSPARRPMAHRYIDAVTTLNFSQKLKDFSDSVKHTLKNSPSIIQSNSRDGLVRNISRKSGKNSFQNSSLSDDALRPVIKKGKKNDSPRRVTFSAYATVQVMDS